MTHLTDLIWQSEKKPNQNQPGQRQENYRKGDSDFQPLKETVFLTNNRLCLAF